MTMTSHTENARTLAACSTCGAEDRKPCRYPSGDVRAPHKSRDELQRCADCGELRDSIVHQDGCGDWEPPATVELFEHEKTYPNAGVVRVTCSKSGGGFELGLRSLSGPECVDCEECGQQVTVGPLSVEWVGRLYKRQDGRSANAALQRHIAAA